MGQGRKQKNTTKKQRSRRKDAAAKRRRRRKTQLQGPQGAYAASDEPVQLMGNKADWLKLDSHIRKMVKNEGLARLARVREMIATDAGLPMPQIRVVPFGWMTPQRDSIIFGRPKLFPVKDHFQWGIIIPAATIVVTDDVLLRRIVCHEFAHCFWHIAQELRAIRDCEQTLGDEPIAMSHEKPISMSDEKLYDKIAERDSGRSVDPANWFGEWDVKHFLLPEEDDQSLEEASEMFAQRWFDAELPIQRPDSIPATVGKIAMAFPEEIVEHLCKLDGVDMPEQIDIITPDGQKNYNEQKMHQDDPPFDFRLALLDQQLRIDIQPTGEEHKNCLGKLELFKDNTCKYSQVVLIDKGNGQCIIDAEDVAALWPQLDQLYVKFTPFVALADLASAGIEAYKPIFAKLLNNKEPQIRCSVIEILVHIYGSEAESLIKSLAEDKDETVRLAVQKALKQSPQ